MAKARASRPLAAASIRGWRQALIFLALIAFAFQGYVVQTHIHFAPGTFAATDGDEHAVSGKTSDHHDKLPPNENPANCPICQEMLAYGQFVTPSAQALLPPTIAVSTIAIVETALPFIFAPSHSWRGRAPPHA